LKFIEVSHNNERVPFSLSFPLSLTSPRRGCACISTYA